MNFIVNALKTVALAPVQSLAASFLKYHPPLYTPLRFGTSLYRVHRINKLIEQGLLKKKKKRTSPLGSSPFMKGIILKCVIKKPRKPNSANRKCVVVRLSNGKEATAYVPGIGHNLQEHQMVLCRNGRLKDVPGVKIRCVRGKYDLPHVVKQVKT